MKKKKEIKIMLVDDHALIRQGLKRVLEKEEDVTVCSEAANADEAIKLLSKTVPDIIIIDISLGNDVDGIELSAAIRKRFGNIKLLILSMFDEPAHVERAVRAGVDGFVTKSDPLETVTAAVREIIGGKMYISASISGKVLKKMISSQNNNNGEKTAYASLTGRELEILEYIGKGFATGEIAKMLNMSVNTVESHRRHIKEKIGITKGSELLKHAIQWAGRQKRNGKKF